MMYSLKFWSYIAIALTACDALAQGPSGGVSAGARVISGKISEWSVPTARYPRDPVATTDGSIFFAVQKGDKIARFDPKTQRFQEWDVPEGTLPKGMVVAADGKVIFGSLGNGSINEFDSVSGRLREFRTSSRDSAPYTLTLDARGNTWFSERTSGNVGKLERASAKITEYRVGDDPYGIAVDKLGNVWVSRRAAGILAKVDVKTGMVTELHLGLGSQPRCAAMAPNGMLWVSLYGTGKLAKVDPVANTVVKLYDMPGGPNGGPYAVNADGLGRIWVSEIQTDNVIMFYPHTEAMRVFRLPSRNSGIRSATIDGEGRYWYVGSHAGTLGVIE